MSLFDSIRFPVRHITDSHRVWPTLPEQIQNDYRAWWRSSTISNRPTDEEQVEYLRKLIQEYE